MLVSYGKPTVNEAAAAVAATTVNRTLSRGSTRSKIALRKRISAAGKILYFMTRV